MYFLFIKVIEVDYFEDICIALQSAGISKASSIEATNLDAMLNDELPFLRGLFITDEDRKKRQLIITSIVDKKNQAVELVSILEESGIDVKSGEILRVILLPIESTFDGGEWKE